MFLSDTLVQYCVCSSCQHIESNHALLMATHTGALQVQASKFHSHLLVDCTQLKPHAPQAVHSKCVQDPSLLTKSMWQ
jgi:hypothetical protein